MSADPSTNHDAHPRNSERGEVLNAVGAQWSRFSRQELDALRTNDELVTQLVTKYGIDRIAAQRHVDTLMNGRSLRAWT
jgi:hypothetical protein